MFIMDIKKTINEIILEVLGKQISTKDLTLDKELVADFGANSMQLLEIALTVSAEFDINVPKEEVLNLQSVQDIYKFVADKKGLAI